MKIDIGSVVKIMCKSNLVESGILTEYNDDQLVLQLADKSFTIILNPKENIIAIRVSKQEMRSRPDRVSVETELEPHRYERREDLRAASLAELHKMRANEERKNAKDLLRSFKIKQTPEVNFGYPSFKSIPKHPKKKTR